MVTTKLARASGLIAALSGVLGVVSDAAAQTCEVPLMVSGGAKPNVLVTYDTSASMREIADAASVYDTGAGISDLYRAKPTGNPNYKDELEDYLATLPATDPLKMHIADLVGAAGTGFTDAAIYDAAGHKRCDSYSAAPCATKLTDAAKCNLGMAVASPSSCADNTATGANERKTPNDAVTNPTGNYAFGKGFAAADWTNAQGRNMPSVTSTPPQYTTAGFFNAEALFQGRWLNYQHSRKTRDDVARSVLRDLVASTKDRIAWCLMEFTPRLSGTDPGSAHLGGYLLTECDGEDSAASGDAVIDALSDYDGTVTLATNWGSATDWDGDGLIINSFGDTPLSRYLYDGYRYLRGEFANRDAPSAEFESPVDHECQDNFVIMFTDGRPTAGDHSESDVQSLEYDGTSTCGNGFTDADDDDAVDDLAACLHEEGDVSPDHDGVQPFTVYTVGYAGDGAGFTDLLSDVAANADGEALFAQNRDEVEEAFASITQSILDRTASATSAAVVSQSGTGGDLVVAALFQSGTWQGNLRGYQLPLSDPPTELWDAGDQLEVRDPDTRAVYTVVDSDSDGRLDEVLAFTEANAATLRPYLGVATDTEAANLIAWVRGEDVAGLRTRDPDLDGNPWKLGDIINSDPAVVGPPPFFLPDSTYQTFYQTYASRPQVVYVGSNDGGLHAFDAVTGAERWMLIPNFNLPRLKDVADPSYCHLFLMDGGPRVTDAYVSVGGGAAQWRTMLVAGSGGDGGYVALDITDPGVAATPNAPVPVWQWPNPVGLGSGYDPATNPPDVLAQPQLGSARARPTLGFDQPASGTATFPTTTSRWRAWIGSGPGSADGTARLFGLELETGTEVLAQSLGTATSNWATEVAPVDLDGDRRHDRLYVGTQAGKLFRYRNDAASNPLQLLFDAGTGRAISGRPVMTFYSAVPGDPDVLAIFGTGRLETTADLSDDTVQRLVVLRDVATSTLANPTTTALVELADLADMTDADPDVTSFPTDGWYIDLKLDPDGEPSSTATASGARMLDAPILLNGVVFASVFEPSTDICDFGGVASLLAVALKTGNAPPGPVMDVDGDGDVDANDVRDDVVPRGQETGVGMPSRPVVDAERKALIIQTSDTTLHTTAIHTGGSPVDVEVWKVRDR